MAIPTVYAGVQFRSRIEARWAAFFDLLRWPWDYEPIDLEGYIPDFLIRAPVPFLVEVKGRAELFDAAYAKIQRSGWEGEALIVADHLNSYESQGNYGLVLGRLDDEAGLLMRADEQCFHCIQPDVAIGSYGLMHCLGSFHDRTGNDCCWKGHILEPDDAQAIRLWREAGNQVQWRSPRGSRR